MSLENKIEDLIEQLKSQNQSTRNNNQFGAGTGSNNGLELLSTAANKSGTALSNLVPTFDDLKTLVTTNVGVWKELSDVGGSFSNDVVRMSVAAKGARIELSDFADIIGKNATQFAGLGGSVTRGIEAFSKFQAEFLDDTAAKEMAHMGWTMKDINETLALQVGFQKRLNLLDQEETRMSMDATKGLAMEMDFLAKLTGKSRELQEKELRDQQRKGEVESKFRLIGIQQGAEAEKTARLRYAEQYTQAAARGQGELFEDMFTKGIPASEEAAVQLALMGKAGFETAESAKALAAGNWLAADAANERAQSEMAAMQNNETLLMLGTLGGELGGAAGQVATRSVEVNDALAQSVNSVIEEQKRLTGEQISYAKALTLIRDDITRSQQGTTRGAGDITEIGDQVGQVTRAAVDAEMALKSYQAGLFESLEVSQKDVLSSIAESVSNATTGMGEIRTRMVDATVDAINGKGDSFGSTLIEGGDLAMKSFSSKVVKPIIDYVGDTLKDRNAPVASELNNIGTETNTPTEIKEPVSRLIGTPGATGGVFENFGSGTLIEAHNREGIFTEPQLHGMATGAYQSGMQSSVDEMVSKMLNLSNLSPASKQQQSNLPGPVKISGITQVQVHGVPTVKLNDEFMTGIKTVVSGDEAAESNTSSKTSESNTSAAAQPAREQQVSETEAKFLKIGEEQGAEAEKIARDTAKIREKEKTALLATLKQDRDPERFTGIDASLQELLKKQEAKDDATATAEFTELFDNATSMLDKVVKVKGAQDETAKQITARYAVDLEKAKNEGNVTEFLKSFVKESEASIEKPESMFSGGKLNLDGLYGTGLDNFTHGKANTAKWVEPKEDQARQSSRAAGQREKTEEEKLAEETRATSSNATVPEFDSGVGYSAEQLTSNMQKSNESLNDLGSKLDQLNSSIVKLTTQQKELSDKQIRAIKANNTRDVNVAVS